ncbi:MAG: CpsD/CapB family tyrosine-protein kinase [Pelotomaculum sp.]
MAKKKAAERELFSHIRPKSVFAEAFRALRTNLMFSTLGGANKVVLVTSPSPEDGKSIVSTNLSVVLAQAKNRVLLVDCDLRKPVLHKYFDVDNRLGLTNLLVQDIKPEDVTLATEVAGLYVIPSGPIPPNPSELLGSDKMAALLQTLAAQYDVMVLDGTPVLAVTDAVLLSPLADSVLLVLKAGDTQIEQAREARNLLVSAGARHIGVVLNEVKQSDGSYYYYYGPRTQSSRSMTASFL